MRAIFFAALLALLILFAAVSALFGGGIMVNALYTSGPNFMQGFQIFCLGSILFLIAVTSYIVTKILTNTEFLAEVLTKMVAKEINKAEGNINPLQAMFGQMGNMPPGMGTFKVARMDEDGNITPIGESKFSTPEELMKHRHEILAKAFGYKPENVKKKFEDMTLAELESEEKKAVDGQQFELAAALRDLIEERKKNK